MQQRTKYVLVMGVFIILILGILLTSYHVPPESPHQNQPTSPEKEIQRDHPSTLPNWTDGEYHDYQGTIETLNFYKENYPDLVEVFSIGTSVQGRTIPCIKITNERNTSHKYSCVIDGCIHGNEWEGGEACLYLAEYLLKNYHQNRTITALFNTTTIYLIPLINPDGRVKDDRFNANGIDLNRNFDVNFGRILGHSLPLGKILGIFKLKWIGIPYTRFIWTNSGRHPFSEPESQALRDFTTIINNGDLSFYLTCHTAQHYISSPSSVVRRSDYTISATEINVMDATKNWVAQHTEYTDKQNMNKIGMGDSMDWYFKQYHIPSFILEMMTPNLDPWFGHGVHDHLVHWMETVLPVFLYLLMNIKNLHDWKVPDLTPPLPDGIPPVPLS